MSDVEPQSEVVEWRHPQAFVQPVQSKNVTIQEMIKAIQYAIMLQNPTLAHGAQRLRHTWKRAFEEDTDKIRLINNSTLPVIFVYSQELVTAMLSHASGEISASTAGASMGVDVERQLVGTRDVQSMLFLPPHATRDVIIGPGYAMVSVIVIRDSVMALLHLNVLIRQGYSHLIEEEEVKCALGIPELHNLLEAIRIL